MSRQAILFPGQGSQYVGMAGAILERRPSCSFFLEEARRILPFDVERLIREGPPDLLSQDLPSQVATFVANAIYWSLWKGKGQRPWAVTGYSLGFYSALMAAEVFDYSVGLSLIREAGRLMEEASSLRPGRMAAIIGLSEEEVLQICREVKGMGYVGLANLNASRQLVISGDQKAVEAASSLSLARGALEVKEIAANAAYHSPLMEEPARSFAKFLEEVPLKDPVLPVLSYADAEYVRDKERARQLLSLQLHSQVRWKDCMERLVGEGVTTFVEVGPNQVLSRLIRWINRSVRAYATDDPEVLERILEGGDLE
ncbi:MAG: ACP S-malonyltransferase [candidate division NC10 bacterium]|nr:ACP S-malonyltransferase [candidate division NC10 bacterium]